MNVFNYNTILCYCQHIFVLSGGFLGNGIAARLKTVRENMGLTQNEFAEKLAVSQTVISRYERGDVKPASEFIISLIQKCNINANWLLTGNGLMFIVQNVSEDVLKVENKEKNTIVELVDLLTNLPEEKRKECLVICKEKKLLYELLLEREAKTKKK